jgi:hypothetical protein
MELVDVSFKTDCQHRLHDVCAVIFGLRPFARRRSLKELDDLRLADTATTDAGLIHLKPLTKLRALVLNGTEITDEGLKTIAEFKGLTRLSVTGTSVAKPAIERLLKSNPTLKVTGP